MESLWGNLKQDDDLCTPKKYLEIQVEHLAKITDGKVEGTIRNVKKKSEEDWSYVFQIESKFLRSFSYYVMQIQYPTSFYPLAIELNEDIWEDITDELQYLDESNIVQLDWMQNEIIVDSEETYKKVLGVILKSNKLLDTISNILVIAKEEIPDLPF